MTKENKRFIHKQQCFIDTEDLSMSYACANPIDCKHIVNKLNDLNDEKEKLKSINQELRTELRISEKDYKAFNEVINKADELIREHLSEYYQRKWKKAKELFK